MRQRPDLVGIEVDRIARRSGPRSSHRRPSRWREAIEFIISRSRRAYRHRRDSKGNPAALQLLTFWGLGVTRRRDLRRFGLAGWTYRAAYDRLCDLFATMNAKPTRKRNMEQNSLCSALRDRTARSRP